MFIAPIRKDDTWFISRWLSNHGCQQLLLLAAAHTACGMVHSTARHPAYASSAGDGQEVQPAAGSAPAIKTPASLVARDEAALFRPRR
jgi:hypothetical protein